MKNRVNSKAKRCNYSYIYINYLNRSFVSGNSLLSEARLFFLYIITILIKNSSRFRQLIYKRMNFQEFIHT